MASQRVAAFVWIVPPLVPWRCYEDRRAHGPQGSQHSAQSLQGPRLEDGSGKVLEFEAGDGGGG